MKFLLVSATALFLILPSHFAHADNDGRGTVIHADNENDSRISDATRRAIKRARDDYDDRIYIYNGDEGYGISRGRPTFGRGRYDAGSPFVNDTTAAQIQSVCAGLTERKFKRCAEDVQEDREKLLKKYRN